MKYIYIYSMETIWSQDYSFEYVNNLAVILIICIVFTYMKGHLSLTSYKFLFPVWKKINSDISN